MDDRILKDASDVEARILSGQEKVLSPEESSQRLSNLLEKQKEILKRFAQFAPKPK